MRCAVTAVLFLASVLSEPAALDAAAPGHHLTSLQARRIARLVARHDQIDLRDTHIEFNSMDLTADFIPGYSSFIVIRESTTPGPDQTLRRYAVNRSTDDVWEMTLCTHYDFPELARMRRAFGGQTTTAAAVVAAEGKELGCSEYTAAPNP